MSLQLKFRYRFEAAHRFLSAHAPACRTPHGHTWYATANFKLRERVNLDEGAMAVEFGQLKRQWKTFITETVDHSYLHHRNDPIIVSLLKDNPEARLLPFPADPTTEMIAGLFAIKLQTMLHAMPDSEMQRIGKKVALSGVHIQETPTNSVSFKFENKIENAGRIPEWLLSQIGDAKGWWSNPDPFDRRLS